MTLNPWILSDCLLDDYTSKLTMNFSNVPGPKEPWSIAGAKCKSFAFQMPTAKRMTLGWAIISHSDVLKVTVSADKVSVQDIYWLKD